MNMWRDTPIEARRLALQRDLDAAKTKAERNRMGQFATPTALARDILGCGSSPGRLAALS